VLVRITTYRTVVPSPSNRPVTMRYSIQGLVQLSLKWEGNAYDRNSDVEHPEKYLSLYLHTNPSNFYFKKWLVSCRVDVSRSCSRPFSFIWSKQCTKNLLRSPHVTCLENMLRSNSGAIRRMKETNWPTSVQRLKRSPCLRPTSLLACGQYKVRLPHSTFLYFPLSKVGGVPERYHLCCHKPVQPPRCVSDWSLSLHAFVSVRQPSTTSEFRLDSGVCGMIISYII
jgi:hypothetical protein